MAAHGGEKGVKNSTRRWSTDESELFSSFSSTQT